MKTNLFLKNTELELGILDSAQNLIIWDQHTIAPSEASERKAKESEYFAQLLHNKLTDKKYIFNLNRLKASKLSKSDAAILRLRKKEVKKLVKLPVSLLKEQEIVKSRAIVAWEQARDENKFSIFAPHLEKLISLHLKEAGLLNQDAYECALANYDETLTSKEVTELLLSLKESIVPLIHKKRQNHSLSNTNFPKHQQQILVKDLLDVIGLDKNTTIGETTHPFQTSLTHKDNRIALIYKANDIIFCIGTALHEGGHALYQQGMPKNICNTILADAPGMSLHESQSRFYETIIGQSYSFVKFYYPRLEKLFPQQLKYTGLEHFYKAVNNVKPSLIRINSDELTYCLHIIIRFELEKRLLDRTLKVKDLPNEWSKLYKKYLGITPTNMKNGVLQDIHWGDGSFGYFPSYAVGNVIAGMFSKLLEKELKTVNKTKLNVIKERLRDLLHKHGAVYESKDMIKKIFKDNITIKPYVAYLTDKYG